MAKNIITLLILLAAVAAVVFGLYSLGSKVDNKNKYQHPITRPGAGW